LFENINQNGHSKLEDGFKQDLFKSLKEKLEAKKDDPEEWLIEQFKILYDAADIIYDKRLDKYDWESDKKKKDDPENSESNNIGINIEIPDKELKVFLDKIAENNRNIKSLRENALTELWNYAERELSRYKHEYSERIIVYSCLAKGNICQRLSNLYFDDYNLKTSDMWGSRANEMFWHGKNLIDTLLSKKEEEREKEKDKARFDEKLILKWLVYANLAKYYRDYASRNRRSDFLSAENLFKTIIDEINGIGNRDFSEKWRRQYALLYMEARRNLITVSNRRSFIGREEEALLFAEYLNKKCNITEDKLFEKLNEIIEELKANHTNLPEENDFQKGQPDSQRQKVSYTDYNTSADKYFQGYDARRMLLLSLLLLSRSLRCKRKLEEYRYAIKIADLANDLSHIIDDDNGLANVNIDVLIIISNSLRKYCVYENNSSDGKDTQEGLFKPLIKVDDNQEKEQLIEVDQLFKLLKAFADNGHLSSKTELIKWYCMTFDDRNWYSHGYLSNILDLASFPDETYINKLFDNGNNNALMEFYRGKVLLDSSNYRAAIKVFEKLISPRGRFSSVTYYVRTGTLGLKARYLLANAYMSLCKYYQAKEILYYLNDTLARTKQIIDDENNNYSSGYPDYLILVDLAYCYIKRGDYDRAYDLYYKIYKESFDKFKDLIKKEKCGENTEEKPIIINEHFLENLPKYKRVSGINNLITCCILSDSKEKQEIGKELVGEINKLNLADLNRDDFLQNPETNLIRGYRKILEHNYEDAQIYFEQLSPQRIDYRARCIAGERKEANLGALYNNVEYVSAYLINTIKLYKASDDKSSREQDIKAFIEGLPDYRLLSLKASMALAEWLIEYEKQKVARALAERLIKKEKPKEAMTLAEWLTKYEKQKELGDIDSLYRYFSYIRIYEERGAGAFNRLYKKNNGHFRLFRSVERGKILARLLQMYRPINQIKDYCTYSGEALDGSESRRLVHYTGMETLKALIGDKKSSHFRLSNCDYANDVYEGHMFFDYMEKVMSSDQNCSRISHFMRDYFNLSDQNVKNAANSTMAVHATEGSDVFIGSFSLKTDSFPMWTIYSKDETGCNIEFGEGFFDVFGKAANRFDDKNNVLFRDYLLSRYMDSDYPLYYIQYVEKNDGASWTVANAEGQQSKNDVDQMIEDIFNKWCELDDFLNKGFSLECYSSDAYKKGFATVKSFAADLINEIRFLFKNADFSYEGEVRIVYTDSRGDSKIDYNRDIPMNYVEVNRKLENLTVTLGSKLSYSDVDKIETWLKHTGKVKQINLALTNRQTGSKNHK
jgi:hypothetical protein